jgi:hypothetical protein
MTREERAAQAAARKAQYDADMAAMLAESLEQFKAAIASPAFAYARARPIGGSLSVWIYHYDESSPSGVSSAGTHGDMKEAAALLDAAGRPFPYSPTEALQSSGARLY